jgi:transposase
VEQLNSLNHSIHRLNETIATSAVDNPEVKLLMGFTGIDYYSAMFLINEIGPVARFSSPKKLVSYAGLAPSTHQSGDRTTHGPITKDNRQQPRRATATYAGYSSKSSTKPHDTTLDSANSTCE